jgi:hypothetical protein
VTEKCSQEVHACQALQLYLLDDLVHGMKLAKVLLCHPIPPVTMGSGEVTGECGERRVGIVPRVEPLLLPPLHLFGHWDVKIRIDTLLELDMDNHTPQNCYFQVRVLHSPVATHGQSQGQSHVGLP